MAKLLHTIFLCFNIYDFDIFITIRICFDESGVFKMVKIKKLWYLVKKVKIEGKKPIKSGYNGLLAFSKGKRLDHTKNGLISFVKG